MSKAGMILRGLKWYNFRSAIQLKNHEAYENIFLPEDILINDHKMEEMEFYLNFVKVRDKDKVHKILEEMMIYDMSNKPKHYDRECLKLEDDSLLIPVEKPVETEEDKSPEEG